VSWELNTLTIRPTAGTMMISFGGFVFFSPCIFNLIVINLVLFVLFTFFVQGPCEILRGEFPAGLITQGFKIEVPLNRLTSHSVVFRWSIY
jgi:hypothetical protein